MNLNLEVINKNKSMVKENSNRTILLKVIEQGKDQGKFHVTVLNKKTSETEELVFNKVGEVTRKYDNRGWEPIKIDKDKLTGKNEKPIITPQPKKEEVIVEPKDEGEVNKKEPIGDDVVTLKDIINELIAEKVLPESLKMKKVRRILRNHQEELVDKSAKKGEAFRWQWTTDMKESLKKDISELLK